MTTRSHFLERWCLLILQDSFFLPFFKIVNWISLKCQQIGLLDKSGVWLCCILLQSAGTPSPQNISLNTFVLLKTTCSNFASSSVVHKDAKLTFFSRVMKVEQMWAISWRELNAGINFTNCKGRGRSGILRRWSHILLKTMPFRF